MIYQKTVKGLQKVFENISLFVVVVPIFLMKYKNKNSCALFVRLTDMQVDIDESMEEWSNFSQGRLKMRKLDIDNIRIINSCMAQTVNLAFYEGQVDKMYEIVGALNQQLEEQSVRISSRELYRHLGENNTISNNVMLSGLRNT